MLCVTIILTDTNVIESWSPQIPIRRETSYAQNTKSLANGFDIPARTMQLQYCILLWSLLQNHWGKSTNIERTCTITVGLVSCWLVNLEQNGNIMRIFLLDFMKMLPSFGELASSSKVYRAMNEFIISYISDMLKVACHWGVQGHEWSYTFLYIGHVQRL